MGRYIFVLGFVLCIVGGCHFVKDATLDYNACLADAVCAAQMKQTAAYTNQAVTPFSPLVGDIAGLLASLLAGILYGKKIRSVRKTDIK